ncbi:hypothetical protein [Yoonia algicola]|uniref:Cupin domain-containing protein n=1 Tax=Yoonia algicola TaxID=3137368 RepID=A0AAN0M8G6_9RHOB
MQTANAKGFDWPQDLIAEFNAAWGNGQVGHVLVSETEDVRVWQLRLAPGERIGFHHHVLDYFWSAVTAGRSRSHMHDGSIVESDYAVGATRHYRFGAGEYMIHDLENIGDTELVFVTVEHLAGSNKPHELSSDVTRL